ncbi:hypothetical protein DIPPA_03167 [Diplonema papillatum]|nr:hypothetical protein DIPPA_03167 [Diplonema papillatum]
MGAFPASWRDRLTERFGELSEPSRRVRLSDLEAAVEPWFAGIPADLQLVAARGFVAELLGVEEDEELRNLAPWKVAATLVEIHGLDGAKFDDILATGKWRPHRACSPPTSSDRPLLSVSVGSLLHSWQVPLPCVRQA